MTTIDTNDDSNEATTAATVGEQLASSQAENKALRRRLADLDKPSPTTEQLAEQAAINDRLAARVAEAGLKDELHRAADVLGIERDLVTGVFGAQFTASVDAQGKLTVTPEPIAWLAEQRAGGESLLVKSTEKMATTATPSGTVGNVLSNPTAQNIDSLADADSVALMAKLDRDEEVKHKFMDIAGGPAFLRLAGKARRAGYRMPT